MKSLTDLFKLIELTRSMPQYGYALSGIKQDDLSNLAEHHYLVTFIAWQLARHVIKKGAQVDLAKVLEFALIHDLGELFGGDIAMPYAKANPKARELAKAFEAENQSYLSKFFGEDRQYFADLSAEILDAQSNESIIAKIADYIEVTHYKLYMKEMTKADIELVAPKLEKVIDKMSDEVAKEALKKFVNDWSSELPGKTVMEMLASEE